MRSTVFDGTFDRTALPGVAVSSPLEDGMIRDQQPAEARAPELRDEQDAAGPEEDSPFEIDFIHGRLSMDLELQGDGEGPELESFEIAKLDMTHFPEQFEWEEELGPEFDLEHVAPSDECR